MKKTKDGKLIFIFVPMSDVYINRWIEEMRRGNFAAAWEASDALLPARFAQDHTTLPRHLQSIWDGRSLEGKRVLVCCYHGLGDTIQFIRYAALLKSRGLTRMNTDSSVLNPRPEVIVWAQASLIPLLRTVEGIDRLLPLHDGVPDVDYDVDVEVAELPYVFRSTLETIPADVPYLHVEPAVLPRSDRMRVGVIWQSGDWDERRSVPFNEIRRLGELPGIDWHVLQRNAREAGWDGELGRIAGGDNPLDDARVMRALDLVITVDTMTAHLAGALGRRTWTLLPYTADWRWMVERSDSPWYPTMRLFRQREEGNWTTVIDEVIDSLRLR